MDTIVSQLNGTAEWEKPGRVRFICDLPRSCCTSFVSTVANYKTQIHVFNSVYKFPNGWSVTKSQLYWPLIVYCFLYNSQTSTKVLTLHFCKMCYALQFFLHVIWKQFDISFSVSIWINILLAQQLLLVDSYIWVKKFYIIYNYEYLKRLPPL